MTHVQEAAAVTQLTVGWSSYLKGANYSVEQYIEELQSAIAHIKSQSS